MTKAAYITTQEELKDFVLRSADSAILCIDTEFLREKTYYAKLCLIQLSTDSEIVLVDPLRVKDMSCLTSLFVDENIVKVFHAASQDLEIILREFGVVPKPLFDTQIAASLLGQVQQIGYGALVQAFCGVKLKKADSFTDWSKRPLTESQLEYAKDDVLYLPEIYYKMTDDLTKRGRIAWLDKDFEELASEERYTEDPRKRYLRLKRSSHLSRKQLSAARELAAWRELKAQQRNIPRKWVMQDEQIVEACRREARSIDDLYQVRGMRECLPVKEAREVAKLMAAAMDLPEDEYPELPRVARNERNVDAEVDLMYAIVRLRARQNGIAVQTLASHDELAQVARGHYENCEVLNGWRGQLVGKDLMDLVQGNTSVSIGQNGIRIQRVGKKG